jgi:protein-S-isoprenylcysteine O-methyltransferase Ste14
MYAAALLVMWLLPVMTLNLLAFFALVSVYFLVGSVHEEALLLRQFGREYEEYRRRVPRIIPGLRL